MTRAVLTLLLLLLLPAAARADWPPPMSADTRPLLARLEEFDVSYDWDAARAAILADRAVSAKAARELLAAAREREGELDGIACSFMANLIARVLDDPRLRDELAAAGLLLGDDFWAGTPLAVEPRPLDAELLLGEARLFLEPVRPVIGLGNLRLAFELLLSARQRLHLVAFAGVKLPDPLMLALHDIGYQLLALQVAQGVADPVISRGERLVRQAAGYGWGERELAARLALIEAGRLAYLPALVDSQLAPAAALADRLDRAEARFAVDSFRFERDRQRAESLSWAEVRRRHDAAWKALPDYSKEGTFSPFFWRWVGQATRLWVRALQERTASLDPAEAAEARERVEADLGRLQQMASQSAEGLLFQWAHIRLDLAEEARLRGDLDEAGRLLTKVAHFADMPPDLREVDEQARPGLEQMFPGQDRRLTDGEVVRLITRYHQERLRVMLARRPERLDPAQARRHVNHLLEAVQAMERGEAGLMDAVGDLAAVLVWLREHPQPDLAELTAQLEASVPGWLGDLLPVLQEFGDRPNLAWMLYQDARLKLSSGDREGALAGLQRSMALVEEGLAQGGASRSSALRARERARPMYELLARTLLEQGQQEQALEVLSRLQQVQAREAVQNALVEGLPAGEDLRQALELQARADSLQAQIAAMPAGGEGPGAIRRARQLLASTRDDYYSKLKELQADIPELERLRIRPLDFGNVQPSIPEDAAVVQVFPTEDLLYLFVATRDDLKVRTVQISRKELDGLTLAALKGLLKAETQEQAGGDWRHPAVGELRTALVELHRILVDTVEEDLEDRQVVAFIPMGVMTYLPFSALARERADGSLEFLVERRQAVSLLKATDLGHLLAPAGSRDGGLVALGNPDGTLDRAAEEVRELKALFPKAQTAFTKDATTAKLKKMCESRPSFVHLATHGTFSQRAPEDSYLVMADGPMKIRDIVGLKLGQPNLVSLSACQSGLGEFSPQAGDDITTLAEAFWYAGSRSLLASMWSVSDDSTGELMVEFYRGLARGETKARALQGAQLKLLKGGKFANPYYWAPFVLLGDWR